MRIVNLKRYRGPYVYAGRFMKHSPVGELPASSLGNPFTVRRYGCQALPLFRQFLWTAIREQNPVVLPALLAVQDDWTLGCWCVDLEGEKIFTAAEVCHCQLIWKAVRYLKCCKIIERV